MMGLLDGFDNNGVDLKGIIPKSVSHIFGAINENTDIGSSQKKFLVQCSYLEIYNEMVLDLLANRDGKKK